MLEIYAFEAGQSRQMTMLVAPGHGLDDPLILAGPYVLHLLLFRLARDK